MELIFFTSLLLRQTAIGSRRVFASYGVWADASRSTSLRWQVSCTWRPGSQHVHAYSCWSRRHSTWPWPSYDVKNCRLRHQLISPTLACRCHLPPATTQPKQLEICGKAQRESARRRKSDRGEKFRGWNFADCKVTWPKVKCISIRKTRTVDLGEVEIRQLNLFVCGPKFTECLSPNRKWVVLWLINYYRPTSFWYLNPLHRYRQSNSKIVRNRQQSWLLVGRNKTIKLFVCRFKNNFTNFLLNRKGAVADHVLFQFLTFRSVSVIFAVKVANCLK